MKFRLFAAALALTSTSVFAQNFAGTWQGSLTPPQGKTLRIVMKVSRGDDEKLKAQMFSIDQGGPPIGATAISQQGGTVKIEVAGIGGEYNGKFTDADNITGTWTQGGPAPLPLNLTRATPQNAWAIPEPAPPPKQMAKDANPVFDVATIKPSDPASRGQSIVVGRGGQNTFSTTNTTLKDLITFAWGVHAKQLIGGPGWIENERFDITAKPDHEGMPTVVQMQTMVKKLLTDRFQIKFHTEKRELSAYALTVAKAGVKMTKTENSPGDLPGFGGRGPGSIVVRNSTMEQFGAFLQARIVDRPVVNQTGLPDRYDFQLKWTPDASQQAPPGQAPPAAPITDGEAPPDLFAAVQQQLGLKLEAVKTPVDVMVLDKVEKPTDN